VERFGDSYAARLRAIAPVIYEESVERAADAVLGADCFIGFDAGMTHVAALAGVRTIAVFGPTDAKVWGPLGPHVHVVRFPDQVSLGSWMEMVVELVQTRGLSRKQQLAQVLPRSERPE